MLPSNGKNGKGLFPLIIFLLSCSVVGTVPQTLQAQDFRQDLQSILDNRSVDEQNGGEDAPSPVAVERVSEAKTLFTGAVRLYQVTLSATDMHMCNFTPSCSRFAAVSVERYGVVEGSLLAADRLERCHGMPSSAQHYAYDPATERYVDPVGRYSDKQLSDKLSQGSK